MSWSTDRYLVSVCWKWIMSSFILHVISNPVPIIVLLFPACQVRSRECVFLQSQPGWLQHHWHSGGWRIRSCRAGRGHRSVTVILFDFLPHIFTYSSFLLTAGSAQEWREQNLCHEDPEKAAHSGHKTAGAHSFWETHHAGGPLWLHC